MEASPGVWAYVQLDGSWWLNNAALLVGSEGAVLIDTCATERRNRALREAVAAVTDRPLRVLVNTHHHGDHSHGNFLFPDSAIVAHDRCREEMIAAGHTATALFPGVEWGELRVAPPFVTFGERLRLFVDDLLVELVHPGAPAHTNNDVYAWIPERRVLIAGDLVFNGGTPFVMMGSVEGALRALDGLRALEPEVVVPGHGDVCGPEVFDEVEAYLRFVQRRAADGFQAGRTPLEAAQETSLDDFEHLLDSERLAGNLHRAYSELRGEPLGVPLDYAAVIGDMVAYNGGQLPRCLA